MGEKIDQEEREEQAVLKMMLVWVFGPIKIQFKTTTASVTDIAIFVLFINQSSQLLSFEREANIRDAERSEDG